jgi:hypothetical protein
LAGSGCLLGYLSRGDGSYKKYTVPLGQHRAAKLKPLLQKKTFTHCSRLRNKAFFEQTKSPKGNILMLIIHRKTITASNLQLVPLIAISHPG